MAAGYFQREAASDDDQRVEIEDGRQSEVLPIPASSLTNDEALVKAAKVMVMAAKPTQMPVLAGGGEEGLTCRKSPSAGTRFRQPPLPEPWLGRRSRSIFGGS